MIAKKSSKDFPVVCVGGSAGGLDAYIRLLKHLPADMGVAIVTPAADAPEWRPPLIVQRSNYSRSSAFSLGQCLPGGIILQWVRKFSQY
jgi:hypothetical protein